MRRMKIAMIVLTLVVFVIISLLFAFPKVIGQRIPMGPYRETRNCFGFVYNENNWIEGETIMYCRGVPYGESEIYNPNNLIVR